MKQVLQNLKDGETLLEEVPVPAIQDGCVLIRTHVSLVSVGTERMLVEFGKGNLFQKARQQPDKVKQVLEKIGTDGLLPTIDAVKNKLDLPIALGYCNVGVVEHSRCANLPVGTRVVSNGKHAECVVVPENLCAIVPDEVTDESAVFTVIASIALQGIRLLKPTLGETIVVTGLGLIGLLAVQLLKANGCRVIGIDYDQSKLQLAKAFGAEPVDLSIGQNPLDVAEVYARGRGIDGALITASTTSNDPIHQAAQMCRKRGRIVLTGVVGMEMSRADFYEKELSFQVSCSYGPGRYDPNYEDKGNDYPLGFVRWTEQRNFEAVLDMIANQSLVIDKLVSNRFTLENVKQAYELVGTANPLGIVLTYAATKLAINSNDAQTVRVCHSASETKVSSATKANAVAHGKPHIGFIGAGNYAGAVLVPAFAKTQAKLCSVSSVNGVSGVLLAKKHQIALATTDTDALIASTDVNTLVISTRHNSHAKFVKQGLLAGKHIFVEKPLAITRAELSDIEELYNGLVEKPKLMVGFNRRFAPQIVQIKSLLDKQAAPSAFTMTVNAGFIPKDHWTQDPEIGGGRIIGELCHFVDLLRFLADSPVTEVSAVKMAASDDSVTVQLKFGNGAIASLNYYANGSKAVAKERLEVFSGGGVLQLDNFRTLKAYGWRGAKNNRLLRQDKGQAQCATAFVESVTTAGLASPIEFRQLLEVTSKCFDIVEQLTKQ